MNHFHCLVEREREMFYLMNHSTHFIYGYMASDIWLRTILIVRKETRCRHIGYSYRLTARVLLYAPSHRQDSTYHSLCYSMIWNRTIQIPREETAATTWATLFNLGFFYMHHPTDRIAHTTFFVTPVMEHWLQREIPQWVPWGMDPMIHCTMVVYWFMGLSVYNGCKGY